MPTLRRTLRRSLAAALLTGGASAGAMPSPAAAASGAAVDAKERNVIHRINVIRRDHGLRPLRVTAPLSAAADRHSRKLRGSRVLSHQLAGERPLRARLHAASVGRKPVGEVVLFARGRTGSATLVRSWMHSPGHRALLLSRDFRTAGVGVRVGRAGLFATVDLAGR